MNALIQGLGSSRPEFHHLASLLKLLIEGPFKFSFLVKKKEEKKKKKGSSDHKTPS